jgi:arylamine N-acetyltransferase
MKLGRSAFDACGESTDAPTPLGGCSGRRVVCCPNSTSPHSPFTQRNICTMPTATGRIMAVDLEFNIRTQETTETIQATTLPEYLHVRHESFGLEIEGAFIRWRWRTA